MTEPVSFLDALKARYGTDDVDQYDANAFLVGDPKRRTNKTWELVGMEKARQKQERYDRLVDVVLKSSNITVAVKRSEQREPTSAKEAEGEEGEQKAGGARPTAKDALAEANMVRLQELDLSGNVDLPLSEIGVLIRYFPSLTGLQVCDVPALLAVSLSPPPTQPLLSSERLTKLIFNNVGFRSVFQLRALVAAPNLTELHLDSNGLSDFSLFENESEVDAFFTADSPQADQLASLRFPQVTSLSLAHNALSSWGREEAVEAGQDTRAEVLRGVGCGLGHTLTTAFPAVTRLFLTGNAMPSMTLPLDVIDADVQRRLGSLKQSTETTDVVAATVDSRVPLHLAFLSRLTLLCLNNNDTLTNPDIVDAVRVVCPSLDTFRITYSHLLPQWNESLSRMYVVASLPTIHLLNRGQVRPKERLDSELFYVQRGIAAREQQQQQQQSVESAAEPNAPTYALLDYLQEKHKDTVLSLFKKGSTAGSDGTAHRMLDVKLFFENGYKAAPTTSKAGGSSSGGGNASSASSSASMVDRQLPSSLTISKLKALIKVVFQIDPMNQLLGYRSGDDGVLQVPIELTNESQTLAYYGVSNGAIIVVKDTSLR